MKTIAMALFASIVLAACSDASSVKDSKCPSILSSWKKLTPGVVQHPVQWNKITINISGATWNGVDVTEAELKKYLNITRDRNPALVVVFDPTGAPSCLAASKIRDTIQDAASCGTKSLCLQGNSADWDKAYRVHADESVDQR